MQNRRLMAAFAVVLALVAGEMQAFAATDENRVIDSKPRTAAIDNAPTTSTPQTSVPPKMQLRRRFQQADVTRLDLEFFRDSGVCEYVPECQGMSPEDVTYVAHQILKTMQDDITDDDKTSRKAVTEEDQAWDRMMDVWGIVIGIGGVAATSAGAFTAYWLGRRQGAATSGPRRSNGSRARSSSSKISRGQASPTRKTPTQRAAS